MVNTCQYPLKKRYIALLPHHPHNPQHSQKGKSGTKEEGENSFKRGRSPLFFIPPPLLLRRGG